MRQHPLSEHLLHARAGLPRYPVPALHLQSLPNLTPTANTDTLTSPTACHEGAGDAAPTLLSMLQSQQEQEAKGRANTQETEPQEPAMQMQRQQQRCTGLADMLTLHATHGGNQGFIGSSSQMTCLQQLMAAGLQPVLQQGKLNCCGGKPCIQWDLINSEGHQVELRLALQVRLDAQPSPSAAAGARQSHSAANQGTPDRAASFCMGEVGRSGSCTSSPSIAALGDSGVCVLMPAMPASPFPRGTLPSHIGSMMSDCDAPGSCYNLFSRPMGPAATLAAASSPIPPLSTCTQLTQLDARMMNYGVAGGAQGLGGQSSMTGDMMCPGSEMLPSVEACAAALDMDDFPDLFSILPSL
jgi:hypothetical protein